MHACTSDFIILVQCLQFSCLLDRVFSTNFPVDESVNIPLLIGNHRGGSLITYLSLMGLWTNQPEEPDGIGVLFMTQMDLVKLQGRFCKAHIVTHAIPAKFIQSAGEELTKSIWRFTPVATGLTLLTRLITRVQRTLRTGVNHHIYLSIYLPTYLSIYLPTYLHTYIPTYLPTYIHTYMNISTHTTGYMVGYVYIYRLMDR